MYPEIVLEMQPEVVLEVQPEVVPEVQPEVGSEIVLEVMPEVQLEVHPEVPKFIMEKNQFSFWIPILLKRKTVPLHDIPDGHNGKIFN